MQILSSQHDAFRRNELVNVVIDDLAKSTTFTMRKTFVLFCRLAVIQFTRKFFEENFYDAYLSLAKDRVPQVRMEFVRGLLDIKPFLDYNQQKSIELTERISELKGDKDDDVADASENTDLELMRTRKQMVK